MRLFFSFKGRIGRLEWWAIELLAFAGYLFFSFLAISFVIGDISSITEANITDEQQIYGAIIGIPINILYFWIATAAAVKRYHDRGKSGWWNLIAYIPLYPYPFPIGFFIYAFECGFMPGRDDNNPYGDIAGARLTNAELRASVLEGGGLRPDVLARQQAAAAREATPHSRQEVEIITPRGPGFGRRTDSFIQN